MTTMTLSRPSVANDLRVTPQARMVLAYLLKGKAITPMKAQVELSISRLASCIHEIRKAGYIVDSTVEVDEAGHRYGRYVMRSAVH
jgi:hypothetical protein